MDASADIAAHVEDIIAGRFETIDFPWLGVSNITQALLPGTLTLVCGAGGATKSFMLLQAMMHWHEQGVRCALYSLEEDRTHALKRATAMRAGVGDFTKTKWVAEHPDEARRITREHAEFEGSFGRVIQDAPDKLTTLPQIAAWIETQAQRGCRIIAVDPVTLAQPDGKQWEADLRFVVAVKTTARQFDCSIILVTHPAKNSKGFGLDDLSGGASYARFSQTVLFMEAVEKPQIVTVETPAGRMVEKANRILHVRKSRNAPGTGLSVALRFDGATLRTSELGVILRE